MDKNWLQFGIQLLYQRYKAITKLLIVKKNSRLLEPAISIDWPDING